MVKAVTLIDVALAAGVSKATVSNAFNRPGRVSKTLRERVESAARGLGYAGPDPKGRLLSSGRVNAIGILPFGAFGVSQFFKNSYQREFLAGVAAACEEFGVGLSLVSAREDQESWGIKNALVDGFIFTNIEQAGLAEPGRLRRRPFVVLDFDGPPDMRTICGDAAPSRVGSPKLRHRISIVCVLCPRLSRALRNDARAGHTHPRLVAETSGRGRGARGSRSLDRQLSDRRGLWNAAGGRGIWQWGRHAAPARPGGDRCDRFDGRSRSRRDGSGEETRPRRAPGCVDRGF
jgi:hypothetical protein